MNHWRAIFSWDVVPDFRPGPKPLYRVDEAVFVDPDTGRCFYATVRSIHPVGDTDWHYTVEDEEGMAHVVDELDLTAVY